MPGALLCLAAMRIYFHPLGRESSSKSCGVHILFLQKSFIPPVTVDTSRTRPTPTCRRSSRPRSLRPVPESSAYVFSFHTLSLSFIRTARNGSPIRIDNPCNPLVTLPFFPSDARNPKQFFDLPPNPAAFLSNLFLPVPGPHKVRSCFTSWNEAARVIYKRETKPLS